MFSIYRSAIFSRSVPRRFLPLTSAPFPVNSRHCYEVSGEWAAFLPGIWISNDARIGARSPGLPRGLFFSGDPQQWNLQRTVRNLQMSSVQLRRDRVDRAGTPGCRRQLTPGALQLPSQVALQQVTHGPDGCGERGHGSCLLSMCATSCTSARYPDSISSEVSLAADSGGTFHEGAPVLGASRPG